jgi:hypothetical protein
MHGFTTVVVHAGTDEAEIAGKKYAFRYETIVGFNIDTGIFRHGTPAGCTLFGAPSGFPAVSH